MYRKIAEGTAALIEGREYTIYETPRELSQSETDALIASLEYVMAAFRFDHPMANMYINAYYYTYQNGFDGFRITLRTNEQAPELDTAAERIQKIGEIESQALSFISTLSGSDTDRLKAIHDYLALGSRYDHSRSVSCYANIYGAMINRYAVCEGYAEAYKYLCDLAGLTSILVTNTAPDVDHTWNYVYTDGAWYGVDVTWDLPQPDGWGDDHWFLFPVTDSEHPQYGDYGFSVLP